jgi:hypothetical protein
MLEVIYYLLSIPAITRGEFAPEEGSCDFILFFYQFMWSAQIIKKKICCNYQQG